MKNKILRAVVALLLVCILIFNISLIKAQAVGVDQFIGVAINKAAFYSQAGALSTGAAAFCWVAAALTGIVATVALIEMLDQYMEWSGDLETSIYYYPDGTWSYGVDMSFVERVRAFLFDTGVVVEGVRYNGNYPDGFAECVNIARQSPYAFVSYNNGEATHIAWAGNPFVGFTNAIGDYYLYQGTGVNFSYYTCSNNRKHTGAVGIPAANIVWVGTTANPPMYSDYGELGTVAPLEIPMPEAYPEWYTNSRPATNPDTDEEITVLPIPLNPSADPETQIGTLTQPNIWQGTIADPMPGMQPDTNPDSDTDIGKTIGNVIKELFIPSPDSIKQKIGEMRDSFPFIDGIISTGVAIRDGLSYDISPPEIWIDLGEATTDTFGHKKYLITDFSWYAPYKPRVDALLSAALWAFFSWRVFIRLPSIIGGEGGQIESFAVHSFESRMEKEQADDRKRRGKK